MKAWWFSEGYTLPHGDGRKIAVGTTHTVEGEIIPCERGLHASVIPLDALFYSRGNVVWRVELGGTIIPHDNDKHCASERTYLAGGIDASETLRKFARLCALDVVHLWDAPEIVVRYLKTGDESIRAAAGDAAGDGAAAVWVAAEDAAAWDADGDGAGDADGAKMNRRLGRMLRGAIRA